MLKKRLLITTIILAAVLVLNLLMIQAADADDLTFVLNEAQTGYEVHKCSPNATGMLSIPESYNGKPVVAIGREAFLDCTRLTGVTIPSSVTSIGWYAFSGCTGLTSISIPDSVTSMDWFAFAGCTRLSSVTIGNGVTCIDASAFADCTALTTITVGKNVTTIGWSAFKNCSNLTTVTLPKAATTIDRYAFYGCDRLATVIYCGTQAGWNAIDVGEENTALTGATLQFHKYENDICTICGHDGSITYIIGDIDVSGVVNQDDAVYLLLHTLFGAGRFPLDSAPGDVDGSGVVNQDDAVYLLLNTLFGAGRFPLHDPN